MSILTGIGSAIYSEGDNRIRGLHDAGVVGNVYSGCDHNGRKDSADTWVPWCGCEGC